MKLLALILVASPTFINSISACQIPFNNVKLAETNDTAGAIQEYMNQANLGWTEAVSSLESPHNIWPRDPPRHDNKYPYTVVRFCYNTEDDRKAFEDLLWRGWDLWEDRIGVPGSVMQHSLKLQEFEVPKGYLPYCEVLNPFDGSKAWNSQIDSGTLVIKALPEWKKDAYWAQATLGYIPQEWNEARDRHHMWISDKLNKDDINAVVAIAHELGHVFGLWHEHQRPDRDHYVKFQCDKLKGYEEKKREIEGNKDGDKMEDVCTNPHLSYKYGFIAHDYAIQPLFEKNKDGDKNKEFVRAWSSVYDRFSIMHYTSRDGAVGRSNKPEDAPLVRWTKGDPHYEPPQGPPKFPDAILIQLPSERRRLNPNADVGPTNSDADVIKKLYPWEPIL